MNSYDEKESEVLSDMDNALKRLALTSAEIDKQITEDNKMMGDMTIEIQEANNDTITTTNRLKKFLKRGCCPTRYIVIGVLMVIAVVLIILIVAA